MEKEHIKPKVPKIIAAVPSPFGPVLLVLHAPFPSPAHKPPRVHDDTFFFQLIKTNCTVASERLGIMTVPVWQKSAKRAISCTNQENKRSRVLHGMHCALAHHSVKHLLESSCFLLQSLHTNQKYHGYPEMEGIATVWGRKNTSTGQWIHSGAGGCRKKNVHQKLVWCCCHKKKTKLSYFGGNACCMRIWWS